MCLHVRFQDVFVCKRFRANIAKCSFNCFRVNIVRFDVSCQNVLVCKNFRASCTLKGLVFAFFHFQMLLRMCLHASLIFELFSTLFTRKSSIKSLGRSGWWICGVLLVICKSNVVIVEGHKTWVFYLDVTFFLDLFLFLIVSLDSRLFCQNKLGHPLKAEKQGELQLVWIQTFAMQERIK